MIAIIITIDEIKPGCCNVRTVCDGVATEVESLAVAAIMSRMRGMAEEVTKAQGGGFILEIDKSRTINPEARG